MDLEIFHMNFLLVLSSNLKRVTFLKKKNGELIYTKKIIPVAPITIRCERKGCTVVSIPLRVCKAITIDKVQGMSIGPQKPFESVIISLPEKGERINPGSKLVTFSRVTTISALAICDINGLITIETMKNIETGSSYNKSKVFD